mgnify:FL=1
MESQARPSVHLPKNSQAPSDRHRKLAEKPGVPASGQSENPQNQNDGVDWDKMMSLEHMKD